MPKVKPLDSLEAQLDLVLITGMSGSGKSVALNALEDAGYYCVDNLPPELLSDLIYLEGTRKTRKIAIAMDVRSAEALPGLPLLLATLQQQRNIRIKILFVDASTDTLLRRYSETRRSHPLTAHASGGVSHNALAEALAHERELLANLREQAHVIDTTFLRSSQLQSYVKAFIETPAAQMVLVFESFAFKRGIPVDADFVFDVRMLPNPYYRAELRDFTGRDGVIQDFLQQHAEVSAMENQIETFLRSWLPPLQRDHRSYLTVGIGCTGGQHRSVYLVERLSAAFSQNPIGQLAVLARHRELDQAGKST